MAATKAPAALGDKVKDSVTGFTGTVTSITHYLNGCTRACVEPQVDDKGAAIADGFFDLQQLKVTKRDHLGLAKDVTDKPANGGPPRQEPPRW